MSGEVSNSQERLDHTSRAEHVRLAALSRAMLTAYSNVPRLAGPKR
jgi:hypothetical protein